MDVVGHSHIFHLSCLDIVVALMRHFYSSWILVVLWYLFYVHCSIIRLYFLICYAMDIYAFPWRSSLYIILGSEPCSCYQVSCIVYCETLGSRDPTCPLVVLCYKSSAHETGCSCERNEMVGFLLATSAQLMPESTWLHNSSFIIHLHVLVRLLNYLKKRSFHFIFVKLLHFKKLYINMCFVICNLFIFLSCSLPI